jgi:hypothetical protein
MSDVKSQKVTFWDCSFTSSTIYKRSWQVPGIHTDRWQTWVHHFTPQMQQSGMQWTNPNSPAAKRFKVYQSAEKVMSLASWDVEGVTCYQERIF